MQQYAPPPADTVRIAPVHAPGRDEARRRREPVRFLTTPLSRGMARSTLSSGLPVTLRRQLDITAALARKRLMEVHFRQAMELIEHTEGLLDPRRALDIYARLHKLLPGEAATVSQDVFVALGRRTLPKPLNVDAEPHDNGWEDTDSTLRLIRRRLRGRVNKDLREWVEFHTGRTETAIFWAHVDNAHDFVDVLERSRSASDAVGLYADELGLSPSWTEIIYFFVLDQRSPGSERSTPATSISVARRPWPSAEARSASLRIVEKRRERGRHRAG